MSGLDLVIRAARRADLPAIVALLADDPLGQTRERADAGAPAPEYQAAFAAIDADPNHELIVAQTDDRVVASLQLSFLPNLTYRGGWRAQIEGVRVARDARGRGVGAALILHALARAREKSCVLVQLTSDRKRPEAIRFYQRLGFVASHEGMKLHLGAS